jgi:hypothetical protein
MRLAFWAVLFAWSSFAQTQTTISDTLRTATAAPFTGKIKIDAPAMTLPDGTTVTRSLQTIGGDERGLHGHPLPERHGIANGHQLPGAVLSMQRAGLVGSLGGADLGGAAEDLGPARNTGAHGLGGPAMARSGNSVQAG